MANKIQPFFFFFFFYNWKKTQERVKEKKEKNMFGKTTQSISLKQS